MQNVDADADFIERAYKAIRGDDPLTLREDFCGTALMASWFIKLHAENKAIAVRELHVAGKKRQSAVDFVRGYSPTSGECFEADPRVADRRA